MKSTSFANLLILVTKITFSFFILFLFLLFDNLYAKNLKIGEKAPNLIGQNAVSKEKINLYRLLSQMQYKRDSKGDLISKNGKYITEFRRNVLVVNFFAKTCIPCLREIPTFNKLAQKYKDKNIKFLYVNVDPNLNDKQIEVLIGRYDIKIPMMLVNQKEAFRKYEVRFLPRLYIINKKKKIAHIIKGFDHNLEENFSNIVDNLLK
jgi:thiol-disulfide isomerase/thioredoxin